MSPTEEATAGHAQPLFEGDVDPNPLVQFRRWFKEATLVVRAPEAVALATASASGAPSVRMVLAKSFDESGVSFFTNYESRKGLELNDNPRAALLFYWDPLGRQVRIEGAVARLETGESDAYFASRPRGSQIGAHCSAQSQPVSGRDVLDAAVREITKRYEAVPRVDRPQSWGGYRLQPSRYEFWQHREDRLHDRLVYECDHGNWRLYRLQP